METLNFISEAKSYQDTHSLYSISVDNCKLIRDTTLVAKQWKRLMSTYVSLESPCQINFPDDIREQLLEPGDAILSPPVPERLGLAIDYAYEIITEDALIPFTRSLHAEDPYAIRLGYLPASSSNCANSSQVLLQDLTCPVNDAKNEM